MPFAKAARGVGLRVAGGIRQNSAERERHSLQKQRQALEAPPPVAWDGRPDVGLDPLRFAPKFQSVSALVPEDVVPHGELVLSEVPRTWSGCPEAGEPGDRQAAIDQPL